MLLSGGAGNRTRVPMHCQTGLYVRSSAISEGLSNDYLLFATGGSAERDTLSRYRSGSLAHAATEASQVTLTLKRLRFGIGDKSTSSPTKDTDQLVGY
jgi:hypothetical protein